MNYLHQKSSAQRIHSKFRWEYVGNNMNTKYQVILSELGKGPEVELVTRIFRAKVESPDCCSPETTDYSRDDIWYLK